MDKHGTYTDASLLSEQEYDDLVDNLSKITTDELRDARGDARMQRLALCRYFKRGRLAGLSTGELMDFLGVSDVPIVDQAGYDDEEGETLMEIPAQITDEEIESTTVE